MRSETFIFRKRKDNARDLKEKQRDLKERMLSSAVSSSVFSVFFVFPSLSSVSSVFLVFPSVLSPVVWFVGGAVAVGAAVGFCVGAALGPGF